MLVAAQKTKMSGMQKKRQEVHLSREKKKKSLATFFFYIHNEDVCKPRN